MTTPALTSIHFPLLSTDRSLFLTHVVVNMMVLLLLLHQNNRVLCTFLCTFCQWGADPPPSKQPLGGGWCNNLKVQAIQGLFIYLVKKDCINPSTLRNKQLLCFLFLHSQVLSVLRVRTELEKRAFRFAAPSAWNSFLSELKFSDLTALGQSARSPLWNSSWSQWSW